MVKEFADHIAWTDSMKDGHNYVGLIEYQRKIPASTVHVLWVINPQMKAEDQAERAAAKMLEQIREITDRNNIIYSDGVAL